MGAVTASRARFVVVSGPPGSGKSTLAPALAAELDLPLLAKDTIKDALMSIMQVPDVEASRQLGRAAMAVMLALAAESQCGAILEGNFHRTMALADLRSLPGTVVEVFCRCDPSLAAQRYRARTGSRHVGHFDSLRAPEDLWNDEVAEPVAGGWPLLEVATNDAVDVAPIVGFVRDVFSAS
jgi:predicted kinase